jgi:ADP-heptose:LPS heptosyltransferase
LLPWDPAAGNKGGRPILQTPAPIRNLVISRPDRLGDVVLSSSCLKPARAHWSQSRIYWQVAPAWQGLFAGHPAIDGLISGGEGGWLRRAFALAAAFRRRKVDAIAILQPDRAVEFGAVLGGVKARAGFRRLRNAPQGLTLGIPYAKSEGARHEALYNFDVLSLLGAPPPGPLEASLAPDPAAKPRLDSRWGPLGPPPGRYAVFHLAAHGAKPRAPLEAFGALAQWLASARGLDPVLVGTELDPGLDAVAQAMGLPASRIRDLRGRTDAAETAWLMRSASFCAARDSGPAHLSAAMGCPTLVFFVDPRPILGPVRWRPLGPKVSVISADSRARDPEKIREAAAGLLGN